MLRLRRAKLAIAGSVLFLALVIAALLADVIAPYGRNEIDLFHITAGPSREHWLGTDVLGRDVLSRLIYGARLSLWIGVSAAVVTVAIGTVVGAIAGYYGGWVSCVSLISCWRFPASSCC
ncbi:MAG: hypothetical protein C4345_13075 [Chloroflexota bacterium]